MDDESKWKRLLSYPMAFLRCQERAEKKPTEGQKQLDKKDQCGAEAPPKTQWYILIRDEVFRIVETSSKQINLKL